MPLFECTKYLCIFKIMRLMSVSKFSWKRAQSWEDLQSAHLQRLPLGDEACLVGAFIISRGLQIPRIVVEHFLTAEVTLTAKSQFSSLFPGRPD